MTFWRSLRRGIELQCFRCFMVPGFAHFVSAFRGSCSCFAARTSGVLKLLASCFLRVGVGFRGLGLQTLI